MFRNNKTILMLVSFVIIAVFFVSCKTEEGPVDFDIKYSVNIAIPKKGWPVEKKLSPSKKAAFDKYGIPNALHIYWDASGDLKSRDFVKQELKRRQEGGDKQIPEYSWVYLDKGIELFWGANEDRPPVEKPISDKLRIIINNGDPQDIKNGDVLQWIYYSTGKIYKFGSNGKIAEEQNIPAIGGNFTRK